MNQDFNSSVLLKFLKKNELRDYNTSEANLIGEILLSCNSIINEEFSFDLDKTAYYYRTNRLTDKLLVRKLNENIKKLYKVEQANRNTIISQIKILLEEDIPFWIIKTDISKFYESIDRERILAKLRNDAMLSYYSLYLLKNLLESSGTTSGLPMGLNISASLSELFMRNFDRRVKKTNGVYFYARFVDDIVVFCNDKKIAESINANIQNYLENGLTINERKTKIYDGSQIKKGTPFEYLGYSFSTRYSRNGKAFRKEVILSISSKKINKIKTRITLSFLDFLKTDDFDLLRRRLQFLTGNYTVKKNLNGNNLKAGIYYNYPMINDLSILDELNLYLRKSICSSNGNFGTRLNAKLTKERKNKLLKFSFRYGFDAKVLHYISGTEMKLLKRIW